MSDDRDDQIRQRAYQLWQDEGEPEGRDEAHWAQASRELGEGLDPTAGTDTDETESLIAAASADQAVSPGTPKPTN